MLHANSSLQKPGKEKKKKKPKALLCQLHLRTFHLGSVSWYQLVRDEYTSVTYRYLQLPVYFLLFCIYISLSFSYMCVCVYITYFIYIKSILSRCTRLVYPNVCLMTLFECLIDVSKLMFETDLWTFPLNLLYPKSSRSLKITTLSLQLLSLRTSKSPFHSPFLAFKIQSLTYSLDSTFITCPKFHCIPL